MQPDRSSVLVVCTANVCRSPMGEALLRHALAVEEAPLNQLTVASAGIAAFGGDPASENSVAALRKVGIDISGHRSRATDFRSIENALAIYVMTPEHRHLLLSRFPEAADRVFLFREFAGGAPSIPDPYGSSFSSYEATRDAMVEAIPSLVKHIRKLSGKTDSA